MNFVRLRRRAWFARRLRGRGLEIGALTNPLPAPNATEVVYSDWCAAEDLERMYPGSKPPDIISDSETFPTVNDGTFDFVIANHVLEHLTDPIGALVEWHRILKDDGLLMLALPDKRFTFDAGRNRTTLAHLIEDHRSDVPPLLRNRCHLEEWATHVENLAPGSKERESWIQTKLAKGYSVHNHVWIPVDILTLLAWLNRETTAHYQVLRLANTSPLTNEFILLLRRAPDVTRQSGLRIPWLRVSDPVISVIATIKRGVRRVLTSPRSS